MPPYTAWSKQDMGEESSVGKPDRPTSPKNSPRRISQPSNRAPPNETINTGPLRPRSEARPRLIQAQRWSAPCPLWVKLRRTQCEQMFSGLPLKADIAQRGRHVPKVPGSGNELPLYSITSSVVARIPIHLPTT